MSVEKLADGTYAHFAKDASGQRISIGQTVTVYGKSATVLQIIRDAGSFWQSTMPEELADTEKFTLAVRLSDGRELHVPVSDL